MRPTSLGHVDAIDGDFDAAEPVGVHLEGEIVLLIDEEPGLVVIENGISPALLL